MGKVRRGYPSDVSDEEWEFVVPYLLLCREDSAQREHDLREVFNGIRYVARSGCPWRLLPHDLPPWAAVYQQMRRWIEAGCFEALVADVQSVGVCGCCSGGFDRGIVDRWLRRRMRLGSCTC
jgi:transposase